MSAIEEMINNEVVQDVVETVVEVQPNTGMMNGMLKNGLYAVAGVVIWEGGKFVVKKAVKYVKAKKDAKNATENEDVVDQEAEIVESK